MRTSIFTLLIALLFSLSAQADGVDPFCFSECFESDHPFGCEQKCRSDTDGKIKKYNVFCFADCLSEGNRTQGFCRNLCRE